MGEIVYGSAIHIRKQAEIDAARITQKSGNALRGSQTALQQFSASLGNKRRMDAAGSQINDSAGNSARLQRSLTHGRMQGRIQAAEELGAAAAMAGAAGVGGASVEAYNETVRLHSAMKEAAAERAVGQQEWANGEQRANALKAAVADQDNNVYRANQDYKQYVDHKAMPFLEKIVAVGATVAATVYGGPQAGAAVMGVFEARQASRNGDFAGASSSLTGAFQNGMGAARSYNATQGGPSAGNVTTNTNAALADLSGPIRNAPQRSSFFNAPAGYDMGSITIM